MNSKTIKIALYFVVVIIIVAVLGYFVWQEGRGNASTAPAVSTSTAVSMTGTSTIATSSNPGYTVTPVPTSSNTPTPPNYQAALVFSDPTLSAAEETAIQSEFAQAQAGIKADPTDYSSWMNLSTMRMEAGDYSGAAADWKYVTELYPSDPTAYANLGNLYATYLKENSVAIADYQEAIKLDSTKEVSFYQNLAQVYISENDTTDAKAVLQQGISAQVAGYQSLQTELSSMQ